MTTHFKQTVILCGLVALIGSALLYKLGDIPLADPDEPRYAESPREMLELKSYMVPYFNYEPRLQKPVLHYWLVCASYKLFDVSEFSARLPSALAALGLLVVTFFFMNRTGGLAEATVTCLIMGSSPLYFVPARLTMPDMVFSCFMLLSLFCFYLGWDASEAGKKKGWYAGFYLLQVLAAWTKGPVGILVPVAVALMTLWRQRELREVKNMRLGWGLALVVLASLPWYAYIYFFVDKATMEMLSQRETAGRIFGWFGRTYDPLYYYLLVLVPGLLPWTFLLPWALSRRLRVRAPNRLRHFLEICFVFVFAFFTICATKKAQYIVMLSCIFAAWLGTVVSETLRALDDRRDTGLIVSFFAFLTVAIVGAFKGLSWLSKNQPDLIMGGLAGAFTFIVPALAAVWFSARGHARSAFIALSLVTLLSLGPAVSYGSAWVEHERSMKAFLEENRSVIARARALYSGVKIFNSLPFYLRRQVAVDTEEENLVKKLQASEPCVVFTSDRRYQQYSHILSPYLTAAKYGKVLLSNFTVKEAQP